MEINTSTSMGELVISEEVISAIATNAAKDVDGIAGFSTARWMWSIPLRRAA